MAGHLIECSAQVTGGNYSFFHEIEGRTERGGRARFGFPWAEVASDGSSVIGKHDGTGGAVTVGTVTSQLLADHGCRVPRSRRHGPLRHDRTRTGRSRSSARLGCAGPGAPSTLKVAMNELGGFRNSFSVALTGLDVDAKAAFAEATFWDACPYGPDDFASITSRIVRTDKSDPASQEEATATWRVTVKDPDERKVGRAFADAMVHTALAGIPGMYGLGGGPSAATPYGVYRPATVPSDLVPNYVHLGNDTYEVPSVAPTGDPRGRADRSAAAPADRAHRAGAHRPDRRRPLGDKGGDANLGVYARSDDAWAWLDNELTVDALKAALPEAAALAVRTAPLPEDPVAQLRHPWPAPGRRRRLDPPRRPGQGTRRVVAFPPRRPPRLPPRGPPGPDLHPRTGAITMLNQVTEMLGIDVPILAFTHCRDVVAAVSQGRRPRRARRRRATRPSSSRSTSTWIEEEIGDRPYGVDLIVPAKYAGPTRAGSRWPTSRS